MLFAVYLAVTQNKAFSAMEIVVKDLGSTPTIKLTRKEDIEEMEAARDEIHSKVIQSLNKKPDNNSRNGSILNPLPDVQQKDN